MNDRLALWEKYMHLQVFNELCKGWIKFMIAPSLFSITCTIIICFFVTIRNEGVPVALIMLFAYVGVSIFATLFWICYEIIMVTRMADGILETLTSTEKGSYTSLPNQQRRYISKRGKATRAIGYRIGGFMEFSLNVPVGLWDEIVNQLLFLLNF